MGESVQFSLGPDGVGLLTINRPAVRNALDRAAMQALTAAVAQAEQAAGLRALIVTGAGGRAFISGGDVRDLLEERSEADGLRQHDQMAGSLDRLAALPVPVIAALEGATRGGGCEVALACDLRIAAEDATLGFAQIDMAVTPGWGGVGRLIRLVGYARAIDLLLTGRVVPAPEALALGLINVLSPPGQALPMAQTLAAQVARRPRAAVRGIKQVLNAHLALSPADARRQERRIFGGLWGSADHAEAAAAFIEKRAPQFRDE